MKRNGLFVLVLALAAVLCTGCGVKDEDLKSDPLVNADGTAPVGSTLVAPAPQDDFVLLDNKDILVVQQNEIILRRRSDQCTAHRCCAICIDQRVAFQILVLYATAGTQHRRQCKDEHKQSIPFHGFAPFVKFCHSRSAPSRARAAFSAFASS